MPRKQCKKIIAEMHDILDEMVTKFKD